MKRTSKSNPQQNQTLCDDRYAAKARRLWPGCVVDGGDGPFALVVHDNPPEVSLHQSRRGARSWVDRVYLGSRDGKEYIRQCSVVDLREEVA